MKLFKVYKSEDDKYEFVKKGWSWPAFFFGIFWFVYKKMWFEAIILFAIAVILRSLTIDYHYIPEQTFQIIRCIIIVLFGIYGNKLFARDLEKRGYSIIDSVEADSKDDAISKVIAASN